MPIAKESTASHGDAVHGERDPRKEELHVSGESPSVIRLDDEMQVIVLDGVVQHTDAASRRQRELVHDGCVDPLGAEARCCSNAFDRDVNRMRSVVRRPRNVRNEPDSLRARLAPEPRTSLPLAPLRAEQQDLLSPPLRHTFGIA